MSPRNRRVFLYSVPIFDISEDEERNAFAQKTAKIENCKSTYIIRERKRNTAKNIADERMREEKIIIGMYGMARVNKEWK